MVWAAAERGSKRNGNKDGWPFDCSGTSAKMVAYGEGKKCDNPSGDNQELSLEASDHRFG